MNFSIFPKKKFIAFFLIIKLITIVILFKLIPELFNQSIFKFNDIGNYTSGNLGLGGNIGFRWLIWFLDIHRLEEPLPIFLAITFNLSIDIAWILLLSRYLSKKSLFFFIFIFAIHPYLAIYTVKFTSIIFAKIGIYFFCRQLFLKDFNIYQQKKILHLELFFWFIITFIRNSNLFIAAPYIYLKLRQKPFFAAFITIVFILIFYFISYGYLNELNPSDRPWSLNYLRELLGLESNIFTIPLLVLAKVLLLFGAREKLYGLGIEPFLQIGLPGLELIFYFLMGLMQFFGFYIAINYINRNYGAITFILLIPLVLAVLTVAHQRYLIPFIPICIFGLAIFFDDKFKINKE